MKTYILQNLYVGQSRNMEKFLITIVIESGCLLKYIDNEKDAKQTIQNFKDKPPLHRIKLLK